MDLWTKFYQSGKISDYLNYKKSEEAKNENLKGINNP